ncbi:MAG: hypothetical protein ACFFEN_02345 [Candidatus Thorarchaeota archaeon]
MAKKGKYQLLSYLVDKELIFYKSLNRNKKVVAFAMLETSSFNPLIASLNDYLRKRFLHYYSLQLNILEEHRNIVLLNFEETKKEDLTKMFNVVRQKIVVNKSKTFFLQNSQLEKAFLEPILKEIKSKASLWKKSESIQLSNNLNSFNINFYNINLNYLDSKDSFIENFLKISKSFNRKGYLILNFRIDYNDEIIVSAYFSEFIYKKNDIFNTEKSINDFFNYNLLNKHEIKVKEIFNLLWRLGISSKYSPLKNFKSLFMEKKQDAIGIIIDFNDEFEHNLFEKRLNFIRLSKNLVLIEQKHLFLVLARLESKMLRRIIKKYKSKYFIYILILNKKEYRKLLDIAHVKSINNIQILNPDEKIDFNIFKRI